MSKKALWYLRRLLRMSRAEALHRIGEQFRRLHDRMRSFGWGAFAEFEGPIMGLPGLAFSAADQITLIQACDVKARLISGQVGWMGQEWPQLRENWCQRLWTLDPVTERSWPGGETRNASYRNREGRGDVKFVWEPNRLQMLQPLALLAGRGDGEAADLAWKIVDGWMAANPPYAGINWTSGIEAASRVVSVLALIGGTGLPDDPMAAGSLRRFLQAHARQLSRYPSLHSSANNHRVSELVALLLLRLCAPGLQIAGARTQDIVADLEREVLHQFHSDGIGAEQSPTYAAYSIEWFVLAGVAADAFGVPFSENYRQRIVAAAEALRWFLDDGGHAPRLGDDDEGRVLALTLGPEARYPASVVALAARWLGRTVPTSNVHDADLRDLVEPNSVLPSAEVLSGDRHFADGGLTVIRRPSSQGTLLLTIDHGPLGFLSIAAHGHADALALTLNWGDEPVLVDAGTYLYHAGGAWRDRFRGTGSHNTLQIGDADQSRIIGPFAWADHAATSVTDRGAGWLIGVCEGWRARFGVTHERRFDWSDPLRLQVEDRLLGKPSQPLTWAAGLSLAPGCELELNGRRARVKTPGGRRLVLVSGVSPWRRVESVYSPAFNHKMSVDRLEIGGCLRSNSPKPVANFMIELLEF